MARQFTASASNSITASIGALGTLTYGTIAAIVRRTTDGAWQSIASLNTSANANTFGLELTGTGNIALRIGTTDFDSPTLTVTSAEGWVLIVATKATGTATPRFHKYNFGAGTWAHENDTVTSADAAAAGAGSVKIGTLDTSNTDYFDGVMYAIAMWATALTDTQVETLSTALTAWTTLAPTGMWVFDQASTGTAVNDRTAGGSNQTAITGTAVAAGDPLGSSGGSSATPPSFRIGTQAFNTASAAVLTIPAGVQSGDYIVIVASFKQLTTAGTINTPSGWTALYAATGGPTGVGLQGAVFYKVAAGTESGTTVTVNATAGSQQMTAALGVYSGVSSIRSSSWVAGSATSATALTVTGPATDPQSSDLVVLVSAMRELASGPANTPSVTASPSTATVRAQIAGTSGSAQNVGVFIADDGSAAGTRTLTVTPTSVWISGQIVLVGSGGGTQSLARGTYEGVTIASTAAANVVQARGTAEAITASDATARNVARIVAVAESIGLTDVLTRTALAYARGTAETVTTSDALTRAAQSFARATAETVTMADAPARLVSRARGTAESVTMADALTRAAALPRGTAESVSMTDVPTRLVSRARGTAETVTVADTLGRAGSTPRGTAESVTISNTVARISAVGTGGTGAMTVSDAIGYTMSRAVAGTGAVTMTDAVTRQVAGQRADAETVSVSDAVATGRLVQTSASETVTVAAVFSRAASQPRADVETLTMDSAAATARAFGRGTAESVTMTDALSTGRLVFVGAAETVSVADVLTRAATAYARGTAELVAVLNTVARQETGGRSIAETVSVSNTAAALRLSLLAVAESVTIADAAARAASTGRAVVESVTCSDAVARAVNRPRGTAESVTMASSGGALKSAQLLVAESVTITDALTRAATGYGRALAETVAVSNTLARQLDRARGVAEAVSVADVWTLLRPTVPVGTFEEISFSDGNTARVMRPRGFAQAVTLADSTVRQVDRARAQSETITVGHLFTVVRGQLITASVGLTFDDRAQQAVSRGRHVLEELTWVAAFLLSGASGPAPQPVVAYRAYVTMTSTPARVYDTTSRTT